MRAFRLLLWLRWRLGINATSRRGRWGMAALTLLMALAFSPLYVGAAVGAYVLGSREGAPALLLVFGLAQAGIVWVSLLAGALGRTFELDKLKRYPFRPLDVFAFNTLASLGEPVTLMAIPSLVAVVLGVAHHDGAAAGLAAAGGALLLVLITAALLQLLLAVLDDFLRREWMRYVAALFFTGTLLAVNITIRRSSLKLAEEAQKAGFTPERLMHELRVMFERLPTVSAPASVGGSHVSGPLDSQPLALAVCLVALALPLWQGARVMSRAVTREALAGRVKSRGPAGRGAFAMRWPWLTPQQAILLTREWLYILRTPAVMYQLAVITLTMVFATFFGRIRGGTEDLLLPGFMMISPLATGNLMLWSLDGPGLRTLFLMPFTSRDLVLSKNLVWLLSTVVQIGIALGVATALRPARYLPQLPLFLTGYGALLFAAAAIGTWVSINRPTAPRGRGFGRRGPGGAAGLFAFLVVMAAAAAVVLAVVAARSLTPDAYDGVVSVAVTSTLLMISAALWWIAMDRHADELERGRERMLDVLTKRPDN